MIIPTSNIFQKMHLLKRDHQKRQDETNDLLLFLVPGSRGSLGPSLPDVAVGSRR